MKVVEEEFEGRRPRRSRSRPARAQTANLALKFREVIVQGAGARRCVGQANYGAAGAPPTADLVELLDFDELYPPSPARDVMVKNCFPCHGPTGWHGSGAANEAGWRRAVSRMFDPDGRVAGMAPAFRRPRTAGCPRKTRKDHQVPDGEFRPGLQAARPEDRHARPRREELEPGGLRPVRECRRRWASRSRRLRLRRSAAAVAALRVGQRRQPRRRLHVGQSVGLDRRASIPKTLDVQSAHEGVADREPAECHDPAARHLRPAGRQACTSSS